MTLVLVYEEPDWTTGPDGVAVPCPFRHSHVEWVDDDAAGDGS